jgi:hypothetical protein
VLLLEPATVWGSSTKSSKKPAKNRIQEERNSRLWYSIVRRGAVVDGKREPDSLCRARSARTVIPFPNLSAPQIIRQLPALQPLRYYTKIFEFFTFYSRSMPPNYRYLKIPPADDVFHLK